jgi:hypothetical protein
MVVQCFSDQATGRIIPFLYDYLNRITLTYRLVLVFTFLIAENVWEEAPCLIFYFGIHPLIKLPVPVSMVPVFNKDTCTVLSFRLQYRYTVYLICFLKLLIFVFKTEDEKSIKLCIIQNLIIKKIGRLAAAAFICCGSATLNCLYSWYSEL